MALHIATDRAFRTPGERSALVAAIVAADVNTQETHWVEWKGPLQIGKAEGQFAIAKAILGFANREPSHAATVCEGTAYMVVGAGPQSAPGVTVVDSAALGHCIGRYVRGPRWSLEYVEHVGAQVLVVTVEAPRPGDPIHTLQKTYDKFHAGMIFHRGTGQSEPAGTREVAMLSERLLQGVREPDLALALAAEAADGPLKRLLVDEDTIQEWLDQREAYVRANSGEKPPKPPPQPPAAAPGPGGITMPFQNFHLDNIGVAGLFEPWAKPGDKKKFEAEVEKYLEECRERLLENVIRAMVRTETNTVTVSVANDTDDPVVEVEVTVRLPKAGLLVYSRPPRTKPMPTRPRWPDPVNDWYGKSRFPNLANVTAEDVLSPIRVSITDRDGYAEIHWNVGNLLADTSASFDFYVIPGMNAPDELELDLSARSRSHRRVARATSTLSLASEPSQLTEWLNPAPTQS